MEKRMLRSVPQKTKGKEIKPNALNDVSYQFIFLSIIYVSICAHRETTKDGNGTSINFYEFSFSFTKRSLILSHI